MSVKGKIGEAELRMMKKLYDSGVSVEDLAEQVSRNVNSVKKALGLVPLETERVKRAYTRRNRIGLTTLSVVLSDLKRYEIVIPTNANMDDQTTIIDTIDKFYNPPAINSFSAPVESFTSGPRPAQGSLRELAQQLADEAEEESLLDKLEEEAEDQNDYEDDWTDAIEPDSDDEEVLITY